MTAELFRPIKHNDYFNRGEPPLAVSDCYGIMYNA